MVFKHINQRKTQCNDLEPYEKIILHIGECDVSAGADVKTLWSNMHKLLLDLRAKITVVVSGILPKSDRTPSPRGNSNPGLQLGLKLRNFV